MPIQKQILRTGTFYDANNRKCVFDEKRLDAIVKNFDAKAGLNSTGNPVPLCIAHPKSDTPAFGWVAKIWRKGSELWAEFKDVNEKMEKWLADKAFKTVSSALIGDVLRHVGVLGAWPPAVAAMKDFELQGYAVQGTVELNENDDFTEIELSGEDSQETLLALLAEGFVVQSLIFSKEKYPTEENVRKWISEHEQFKIHKAIEETEESFRVRQRDPGDFQRIRTIKITDGISAVGGPLKTNLQKGAKHMKTVEELTVELVEKNAKITSLETNVTDLTADRDAEKKRADDAEKELKAEKEKVTNLEKENKEFKETAEKADEAKADLADAAEIDKRITAKKIMPAEKESLLMTMKGLRGKEEKEYELAEGKTEKMTPRDYFLAKLDERPELPLDDEVFQGPKKSDENTGLTKLEAAVRELQVKDVNLGYGDAMKRAIEINPELNKASVANAPA